MRTLLSAGLTGALLLASSYAENLLENASFEFPRITGRVPVEKGGTPAQTGEEKTLWTSLVTTRGDQGGRLITGLTDEIALDGKQSLFVDFEKLTAPGKRAILNSELLPIQPNQQYRISIWGRLDRARPISLDERRPHLLVEVEYFAADQETQVGDTEYRIQMIPGSIVPGLGTRLLFVASKWNEYHTEVKSPTDAAFMKVAFTWQTSKDKGETDGVLYLDKAAVDGPRGSSVLSDGENADEEADSPSSNTPATSPAPKTGEQPKQE